MAGFRTRGQPRALAAVRGWVTRGQAPHALLLVGPDGVGKTTLALDLVAGLCCLADEPAERPCRSCLACRKIEHGSHPDLHRLAPGGSGDQIQIGDVRRLVADLALLPAEARLRAAIVEHAQRLNPDAQNALLKLLEDAPPDVVVVLTAEAQALLLDTLVSRCQRLRLGPVAAETMAALLVEAGAADAGRAATLARAAGGRPGVALALAVDPEAGVVEARLLRTLLDLTRSDRRGRLAAAPDLLADARRLLQAAPRAAAADEPAQADPAAATETPPEEEVPAGGRRGTPAERRRAALRLFETWRWLARDLAVVTLGGATAARRPDLIDELRPAARGLPPAALAAFLARLDGQAAAVAAYANPELAVDGLLLAWPRADAA